MSIYLPPPSEFSDEHLWTAFTAGDEQAFAQLFSRYYKKLFHYGRKFSANRDAVEDNVQELFTELWNRKAHLGPTQSVKNYLYKSIRRRLLHQSRSRQEVATPVGEAEENLFELVLSPEQLLLAEQTTEEQLQRLHYFLNHLTNRQREAIYLRFYSEMEYEEIASVMSLSYQSVRNLIYEALKILRQHLLWVLTSLAHFYWIGK